MHTQWDDRKVLRLYGYRAVLAGFTAGIATLMWIAKEAHLYVPTGTGVMLIVLWMVVIWLYNEPIA